MPVSGPACRQQPLGDITHHGIMVGPKLPSSFLLRPLLFNNSCQTIPSVRLMRAIRYLVGFFGLISGSVNQTAKAWLVGQQENWREGRPACRSEKLWKAHLHQVDACHDHRILFVILVLTFAEKTRVAGRKGIALSLRYGIESWNWKRNTK
jgi:hypothetical protein